MQENLRELLLGGQSFSWKDEGDGVFSAVLNEKIYRIKSIEEAVSDPFLYDYFDLGYDYASAREAIASKDSILREAVESVGAIRLLHQDHFTATRNASPSSPHSIRQTIHI